MLNTLRVISPVDLLKVQKDSIKGLLMGLGLRLIQQQEGPLVVNVPFGCRSVLLFYDKNRLLLKGDVAIHVYM